MTGKTNVKIYKSATKKSIMDVTSALDYYKEKESGELEYKGNLVFAITELVNPKKYEKAFVSKKAAKVLFYSIINHTFHNLFKSGFTEYGGSRNNGAIRSRIFTVKLDNKNRFIFQIDEGTGTLGENGSITMNVKEKTVQTYVAYEEAQKLAHEVYDFIKESEMMALFNGKPFYTIVPSYENGTRTQNEQPYKEESSPTQDYTAPIEEEVVNSTDDDMSTGYIIRIGNLKGTPINTLDTGVLEMILAKLDSDTDEKTELIEEARKELASRY